MRQQVIDAEWRIYASVNYAIIGSDNDDGLLSIRPQGTYFNEILFGIQKFSLRKMQLKMLSAKMAAILSQPQFVKTPLMKMA